MFFPMGIQNLQHDPFFKLPQHFGTGKLFFFLVRIFKFVEDTLAQALLIEICLKNS